MKQRFTLICTLFYAITFFQLSAQDELNMAMNCNWDNDNLPIRGGLYYNDIWGWHNGAGTEIAVIGGTEDIFFLDVSNCNLIDSFHVYNTGTTITNKSLWRDFKSFGNYVYAVADEGSSGLIIFDMSLAPATITQVLQTTAFFDETHNIFIDEQHGRLYVAGSDTRSNGLIVLDINGANATNPVEIGDVGLSGSGGYVHDVYVKDHIAYASHGNNGLTVYNFTNAAAPIVMGTYDNYPNEGYNHSSWVTDANDYLVFCDENYNRDVKRVEITLDLVNNVCTFGELRLFRSQLESNGNSIAHNPFILGNEVFISYYDDGVQVFDISLPDTVLRTAYYDTYPTNTSYNADGAWGVYPYLPSGKIIASDVLNGFYSIEKFDNILAAESLALKGERQGRQIRLEWQIESPRDYDTYKLEYGHDLEAMTEVEMIEVDPSQELHTIDYTPAMTHGMHHFKLTAISESGQEGPSKYRSVFVRNLDQFKIAGNNVNNEILIYGPSFDLAQKIEIYSMGGQLVQMAQWPAHQTQLLIDINLPAGIYVAKWEGQDSRWVERFQVTR